MKTTILILWLATVTNCFGAVPSQPPIPSAAVSGKEQHGETAKNGDAAHTTKEQALQPPSAPVVAAPAGRQDGLTGEKGNELQGGPSDEHLIAIGTIALAGVTAVLAVFTLLLWRSTSDLVKETDAAAKQTERAYIFVDVALVDSIKGYATPADFLFKVTFSNQGKTPAEIIKLRGYMELRDFSEGPPHELIHWDKAEAKLPPGLGVAGNGRFEDDFVKRITPQETKELRGLTKMLYAVGRMTYRDIFGREFETGFCWQYFHHSGVEKFIVTRESRLNKRT